MKNKVPLFGGALWPTLFQIAVFDGAHVLHFDMRRICTYLISDSADEQHR